MKRLINKKPDKILNITLGLLPFVLLLMFYVYHSGLRLEVNPSDKLLPSFEQMEKAVHRMAFEPNKRTGEYLLWTDTASSLKRLGLGVLIAAVIGMVWGMLSGSLPLVNSSISPLLTVVSLVPPLALLPMLFIAFGLDELSKVILIVIGITPAIARDIQRRAQEIPMEQIIKAQTLGANTAQIISRVIFPQLMPKLIDSVRLSLGTGWLFLISAEAIASTGGLGYRIFLVRRYLAMDVILPYVVWITLLAFILDSALSWSSKRFFPWNVPRGKT